MNLIKFDFEMNLNAKQNFVHYFVTAFKNSLVLLFYSITVLIPIIRFDNEILQIKNYRM